jgi:NhaP-type Na+/H+ or K+/H+ antiporter
MPWAAAIALGAVLAPPDAVAATAVLRQLRPPHRILTILEGESLLNDASALLIFNLIVLTAFAVVLGTLVIQGLTLKPLLRALDLHDDDPVGRELRPPGVDGTSGIRTNGC